MGVPKDQAQRNRQHIVDTASRIFRERGVDGVGVADLMKQAGFTHGGFYNHFDSKDALAAEACTSAFDCAVEQLARALEADVEAGGEGFRAHLETYLSAGHCDDPGGACPLPTLAVDAARRGERMQAAYARGVERFLQVMSAHFAREGAGCARQRAIALLTGMVGALIVARGVGGADPRLSDEILAAARGRLSGLCGDETPS